MGIALNYTVLPGDSLAGIVAGLNACAGVSYQSIEQANSGINPTALMPGQVIDIPSRQGSGIGMRYTVLQGDSFYRIASNLSACAGVTGQAIAQANPGIVPDSLSPGQMIGIPTEGSSATPVISNSNAANIGCWDWTWRTCTAPAGANIGIAFSGWSDPATALQQSAQVKDRLVGARYISLGGGNQNGRFTSTNLAAITAAINAGSFAGYDGIAYDVEEGDSGLALVFQQSFAAAKAGNFKVLVTVSHSAPYGIADASSLMQSFFADGNIDFLSPQLYTTGDETSNDYATSGGVQWSAYAQAKAAVIPSLVKASMYDDAVSYFRNQDVHIQGFVQWNSIT